MPIKEAIAKSGGITANADSLNIQIIRGSLINPKIYILSFRHILYLKDHALLLMPGDIIYVSERPITTWNRFITQLLPTIGIVDSAVKGFKNLGLFINE
jgi:polysaccharide export outer membrane protein